mmetsp:Transcript_159660/g.281874  ORF Transcript_159660/g.281874 Transcript_159660/m.281874 type:complete len:301 (+) Transcript_159660:86-988(+)
MHRLAVLLIAAQSAFSSAAVVRHVKVRAEPATRKAKTESFSEHVWNSTMAAFVEHEVLMVKADPPKVDKVLYVVCAMLFGCCGCDRCFMGQVLLGCLKGFTGGGFVVWYVIDYVVCCYCALAKMESINMVGYDATFKPGTINNAFYGCIILFIVNIMQQFHYAKRYREQLQMERAMSDELVKQPKQNAAALEQLQTPQVRRHTFSMMPCPFRRMLRRAGIVGKDATVPELIEAFQFLDKDGDGHLDPEELKEALSSMGVSDDAVKTMISEADKDGDGKINKCEFLAYYVSRGAGGKAAAA